MKMTILDHLERIKEEYNFIQTQVQQQRVEIEKLSQEKEAMQRHYMMYYEMSYGLNVEMHKQTEIAKRYNAILSQIIPLLPAEHQQSALAAMERARQISMAELHQVIIQCSCNVHYCLMNTFHCHVNRMKLIFAAQNDFC